MLIEFCKSQYQRLFSFFLERQNKRLQNNREIFLARTVSQSDTEFVQICFEVSCEKKTKIALSIRNAIANLGNVEPQFIHAEISFEELDLLKFWECCGDAGFDTILFIEAIEKELNVRFTDEQLQSCYVQDPDLNIQLKICDFIRAFYRWYDCNIQNGLSSVN